MKKPLFAAVALAFTFAAMAQTYVVPANPSQVIQQTQQLASKGATAAYKSMTKDGIYGLAVLSSDCMQEVKAGTQRPEYCLGIEAYGSNVMRAFKPRSGDRGDDLGATWFGNEKATNRVRAYCTFFMKISSEMACGERFILANMAMESVVPKHALTPAPAPAPTSKPAEVEKQELPPQPLPQEAITYRPSSSVDRSKPRVTDD